MTVRILVVHAAGDAAVAEQLITFFRTAIPGLQIDRVGASDEGDPDATSPLQRALGEASAVLLLGSEEALQSPELAFQVGAAWAIGRQLYVLLDPASLDRPLYLPLSSAHTAMFEPEAVVELCQLFAAAAQQSADLSYDTRQTLSRIFPRWEGLERQSGERPVVESAEAPRDSAVRESSRPPRADDTQRVWPIDEQTAVDEAAPVAMAAEPVAAATETGQEAAQQAALQAEPQAETTAAAPGPAESAPGSDAQSAGASTLNGGAPSCGLAFLAGRAVSECVFHRDQGGPFAGELDESFGAFLSALGGNWGALRTLEDLDLWAETAENLLSGLEADDASLRHWYGMGFELGQMLNLATNGEDLLSENSESRARWEGAWERFSGSAQQAGLGMASLVELEGMLDNLMGPEHERDYTLVGRVQERMRDLVGSADAQPGSGSALA